MPAQALQRRAELPRPRPRDRIVERDHEASGRRGIEAALDQLPGFEIVGERHRTEIVAERRADPGGDREHRRHPRHDDEIERAPRLRPRVDLRAHGGGHGEHAGIAARDDRDLRALRSVAERRRGARALLAVVGGVAGLAFAHGNAVEIGAVAVDGFRGGERVGGLRREPASVARAEPHDCELPAQLRPSQPGTSTIAKYGAQSSALSASRITTASFMVPRST